ncbi:MAG TPA: dockerin type I domain-containing protein [Tepidisphaeraceae bacterium]|nr:dockerin type I domain-containing protein [Tepidisphaeraceae bacterium]
MQFVEVRAKARTCGAGVTFESLESRRLLSGSPLFVGVDQLRAAFLTHSLAQAAKSAVPHAMPASSATVVYDSHGFEAPTFAPGNLVGQDSARGPWLQSGATGTAVVETSVALGAQAVEVTRQGGDVRFAVVKPFQSVSGTMEVDWAMNVPAATGAQSFGPFFGIEAYNDTGAGVPQLIGSAGMDAKTGEVLFQDAGTGFIDSTGTTIAFGQFHAFRMLLNFDMQQYQVYVDGSLMQTQGFVDGTVQHPITSFTDADLSALGAAGDATSQAAVANAYFDDYVVSLPTAPQLVSTVIGDGTTQRSEVRQITLNFNKPVTLDSGAVTLSQLNTGGSGANDNSPPSDATSALGTPTSDDGGMTWVIPILPNTAYSDATGSLKDGIYGLTVHGGQVSDSANQHLAGDQTFEFHRLFGDINGDKTVNLIDYRAFKNSFLSSTGDSNWNPNFDVNGDGTINLTDYRSFKSNYLKQFTY